MLPDYPFWTQPIKGIIMAITIRELRDSTGLTQKAFAEMFDIPVSTLRKWEQGDTAPATYVVKLLSKVLPQRNDYSELIQTSDGKRYYYDINQGTITDSLGNVIHVNTTLDGVKRENLPYYVQNLFDSFYEIQNRFEKDCEFDKKEDILWS